MTKKGTRPKETETLPPLLTLARNYYRMSVEQYHGLIDKKIIREGEKVELLEGCLVQKMTQHPPHSQSLGLALDVSTALLPAGWVIFPQLPITLSGSEPEPDL